MNVYDYVVWYDPEDEDAEAEIIDHGGPVLAKNDGILSMKLIRQLPEQWDDKLDEVKINLRPW